MSNPTHHTCSTCGHTWRHGQYGGHSCATLMAVTIAEQARELAALKAQPRGVVPSGWRIDREGDRIVVQGPYGGYAAERQGQSGIAESILYCLADAMLGLNSSPISGSDARKLSDIGNELHNLSCHVVHHNESWANQLGALASELWYWLASADVVDEREAFEVDIPTIAATFDGLYLTPVIPLKAGEHLMTVSQHLRIEKQLRAALSATAPDHSEQVRQMVPQLPAFAQKVISKLKRFEECTDDGQGADIGRHWFDLLTQLGLLNRVQRSPGLWEITAQGEDVLAATTSAACQESAE